MDTRKNNKVLSVSYGHFSCSVEGFDDSFEVMTSVVEFFRNLAQEDRYFGAEPVKLTPDLIAELSKKTQISNIEVTQDADNLTVRKSSHTQMAPVATSAAFALNERLKRLRAAETDMSDNADSDGETDMIRLLKAAKEQMDEPESHRKRNALEHLRAAVAATLADKSILSRDKSKRERDDTSEDNIAPKRPAKSKSAATGVPVTPLVLQMDQRVDMDKSGSSTPEADSA